MTLSLTRRGVHGLVAVAMLTGFAIVMSGALLIVLSDYAGVWSAGAECALRAAVYETGDNRAYMDATLHNLGSSDIVYAEISPGAGTGQVFNTTIAIPPGGMWDVFGSFEATGVEGRPGASVVGADESRTTCFD